MVLKDKIKYINKKGERFMAKIVKSLIQDSIWSPERRQVLGIIIIAFGAGVVATGAGFYVSGKIGGVE